MKPLLHRSLRHGLVFVAGAALAMVYLVNHAVQELIENNRRVVETIEARAAAEEVLVQLQEITAARLAWRLTSQDSLRERMEESVQATRTALTQVRGLMKTNPAQLARVNELEPLVLRTLELGAQTAEATAQRPVNSRALYLESVELKEAIRGLVEALVREESHVLAVRSSASETAARIAIAIVATVSLLIVLGLVGVTGLLRSELSVREQAELALRQGEERFRSLLEAAPDAMVIADESGRIVLVNTQAERLFGWTKDELKGQTVDKLVPDRLRAVEAADRADYTAKASTQPIGKRQELHVRRELSARRKDGSELPVEISISPLRTAQGMLITTAIRDITERKQAEQARRESAAAVSMIFRASPAAISINTVQGGRLIEVNERYCEFFGYTREELIGKTISNLRVWVNPADRVVALERLVEDGSIQNFEARYRRRSGEERDVLVSMELIDLAGETEPVLIAMFTDITERKQAEVEVRSAAVLYESLVNSIPLAVFRKDLAGRFVFGNTRFCQAIGRSWKQLEGRSDLDFFPAELAEKYRQDDARVLASGANLELNEVNIGADGVKRYIHVIKCVVRNPGGEITGVQGIFEDITARSQAESGLMESERRFRQLVHTLPAAVYTCDVAGRVTLYNQAAVNLWGAEPDLEHDLWSDSWKLFKPDGSPMSHEESPMALTLRFGKPVLGRVIVIERPDGTRSHVLPHPAPTFDTAGKLTGGVNIMVDLTDRLKADEVLAHERRLLRIVIDNLPGSIFAKDADGRYTVSNRAHQRLLGATREADLLGKTAEDFFPADTAQRFLSDDQSLMEAGQPVIGREECVETEGRRNWSRLTKIPLRNEQGQITGLVGIKENITEQKEAGDAVRRAELKYRNIFDNAVEGIFQADATGRMITANPTMARLLGYADAAELLAASITLNRDVFTAADSGTSLLRRAKAGGRDFTHCQLKRRDEKLIWVSLNLRVTRNELGALEHYEGTCVDIGESRRLEEQLRQSQKTEAIGQLAGGIAHDFNNILGAILGNAELAKMLPPEHAGVRESLDAILGASQRATSLVRQILAFSRRQEANRQPMDLRVVVREVLKLLRATIPAAVEFKTNLTATATVLADPSEIHQVAMNLCTNAWHALGGKPGVIQVALTETEVSDELARVHPDLHPGRYVRLTVQDSGCGMDDATRARIFDPFFTTKPAGEGTGLGLAVVHGIVKNHEGGIIVESQLGIGTAFQLYFPVLATELKAVVNEANPIPIGAGQRILFLDDEVPLVEIGAAVLGRLGYEVTQMIDSTEAIACFRAAPDRFDLVITDYNMPGKDGAAVVRLIHEIRPAQPVILVTGYSAVMDAAAARECGFSALLCKPYDLRTLGTTVARILQPEILTHDHSENPVGG